MRPVGRLCGLIWLLTAGLAVPAAAASEQRVALVIGNSAYAGAAALKNPVNDARAMGAKLRALGFDVTEVENGTKQQMERAIGQFSVKLNADSVSMFFYAGHGMQVNGKNYLVPVDAEIATEQTVRLEAVDVDAVLDQMSAAQARVNIVVLDACRNNPFERRFRGQSGGLASMDAPAGSYIAYATAPGKVAADGAGNNGLYTSELLAALDTPNAKIEDVFKHVRASVMEKSAGQQTPWESSSLTGDFYFHAPTAPGATAVAAAAPSQPTTETLFWETIKDSRDPADFRAYLQQYPNGSFAVLARNRVAAYAVTTAPMARSASAATPTPAPTAGASQVAAAAAAPSAAGLASPPKTLSGAFVAPKPGTKLFMSTGGGVQIARADGKTLEVTNLRGDAEPPMVGLFYRAGPEMRYDRAAFESIWPLEVGKTVSTVVTGPKGGHQHFTLRVAATESVTVPAGRFDCFVVEITVERANWVGRFREWYAPAVGFIVKNQLEMLKGDRPPNFREWELVGVAKP